ncbi:MAG: hypothetical protein Q6K90_03980 [Gloeomargarita sp. HHBFW_bins_162]
MSRDYPVVLFPQRLKQALELLPAGAPPRPVPVSAPRRHPRWPWGVSLAVVVAAGIIIGGTTGLLVAGLGLVLVAGGYGWETQRYRRQVQHYQTQQAIYEQQKQAYDQWLAEHAAEVQVLRQPKIQFALEQVMAYPEPAQRHVPGVTEPYLQSFLEQYFPGKIHIKLALGDPIKTRKRPYEPDFTYIDENLNLYIDIEIDEPYYYDAKNNVTKPYHINDEKRNEFFLSAGWVVVRFSEYQVVTQPRSCCKQIAHVIAQVQQTSLAKEWSSIPDLQPDPCWDETQAKHYIRQRTRYHYLKKHLPKDIFRTQQDYIHRL